MTPPTGRRERKKTQTRRALSDAALRLFLERGYDRVSVKEIADAADVSVTTLFTYFPEGKHTLVFDEDASREESLLAAVRQAEESVPGVLDALQAHLRERFRFLEESRDLKPFLELVESTPELAAHAGRMWLRHETALAEAIALRTGRGPDDIAVVALARYVLDLPQLARRSPDPLAALDHVIGLLKRGWGPDRPAPRDPGPPPSAADGQVRPP
ncbi:TetR/AcrR family transcriptional regulator [Actinocorallia sp. B10E7]|uniref:TetR/AcrR family transcriptional regulator n=1 Tax=Actinocorallia sp. B10E7 TaxID=3153558 RepID=UPI00325D41D7